VWVSGKVGQLTLTLKGETWEDFASLAHDALGEENVQNFLDLFKIAFVINADAEVEKAAKQNVIDAMPQSAPAAAPQAQGAPATADASTEVDKFGRVWTYGIPGAPMAPSGPMVRMDATSQAGKPYSQWVCITQSPSGFRQKMPKSDTPKQFVSTR
jgi:hypothetical protein